MSADASTTAKICLQAVIDREKECTATFPDKPNDRFYPLTVMATEKGVSIETTVYIECVDVNDNIPLVRLSPAPYPGVICENLQRKFNDTAFLEENDLEGVIIEDGKGGNEGEFYKKIFLR